MGELVTLSKKFCIGFKMVSSRSPPPAAFVFLSQPQSHPVKISGSASGDIENEEYYFGPVSIKCRLQTGYKMHSGYKIQTESDITQ